MSNSADHNSASKKILIEVCVASVEAAKTAELAGANRIELNCALELDGLSPSPGLLQLVASEISIPIITMARTRGGDFVYTDGEWETIIADAKWQLNNGAAGIAFGCLTESGQIDRVRCDQMRAATVGHDLVFHKAFDEITDWAGGLELLVESGVDRIMTSGQKPTALEGLDTISAAIEKAAGRIEILPAGRIGSQNAVEIVDGSGANQLHGSFSSGSDGNVGDEIQRTIGLF